MKRNFLLMLLLTLLPLAGWADDPATGFGVAKIGTQPYESLQAAINAVTTGGTIELTADITVPADEGIELGGTTIGSVAPTAPDNYTIDLKGKNITLTSYSYPANRITLLRSSLAVTIQNTAETGGVISGTGSDDAVNNADAMLAVGPYQGSPSVNGSTLTISKGVTITSNNVATILVTSTSADGRNTLNVYGTVTTGSTMGDNAIATNGSNAGAIINVYDGAVITGPEAAIYLPAPNGACTIYGGTITGGAEGIVVKGGDLTILGGTITSTAPKITDDWTPNNNGANAKGHALQVEQVSGYTLGTVSVTGGKFVSAKNPAVGSYGETAASGFLKGGNYSSNVINFVAEGYVTRQAGDNSFNVIPGDLVEVQVNPVNGIQMTYGSDFILDENKITVTPTSYNTDPTGLKAEIVKILKVNEDLSKTPAGTSTKYSVSLKDLANNVVIFGDPARSYIVSPIGEGNVEIVKGKNELIEDGTTNTGYVFSLAEGLKYNADEQSLIAVPEDTKIATLGAVEFFSISKTNYEKAFNPDPDHATGLVTPPAQYDITNDAGVLGKIVWKELPKGMDADEWYVWAKAADGSSNYEGDDPVYVGSAIIAPNYPTLAGTITVNEKYYVQTDANGWNGIHDKTTKIAPTGTVNATFEGSTKVVDVTAKVSYLVLEGVWNDDHTYIIPTDGNWTPLESTTYKAGKSYKVMAIYQATDNPNLTTAGYSDVQTIFDVVKPTLTLHTTATPEVVAYGVMPEFSVADPTDADWTGYKGTYTKPSNITYQWYSDAKCENRVYATNGKYPVGPYWVKAVSSGFATSAGNDFNVEVVAVPVNVSESDIMAQIESYTGEDAFVYGETLPTTLTFVSGDYLPGSQQADRFEQQDHEFTATKVKKVGDKYEEVLGEDNKPITMTVKRIYPDLYPYGQRVKNTTILPVGTWKVSANDNTDTDRNRNLLVGSGIWEVVAKDINNTDDAGPWRVTGLDNFDLHMTYTSKQIKPTGAEIAEKVDGGKGFNYRNDHMVEGRDYEISNYGENKYVKTGGTFTVTGMGNYKGTATLAFVIDPAELTVSPKVDATTGKATWAVGSKENFEIDVDAIKAQLAENFKNDKDLNVTQTEDGAKGFKDLKVRLIVPSTVGTYAEGVEAYLPADAEPADNYTFKFTKAPLEITKGLIELAVVAQEAEYNGTTAPVYKREYAVANEKDLNPILVENWASVVNGLSDVVWSLTGEDTPNYKWNVGGTYTITATLPTGKSLTATNYNVVIKNSTAALTVKPANITVKANDLTLNYSQFLNEKHEFVPAKKAELIAAYETKVVDEETGETEVNDASVTITSGSIKAGDAVKDIVKKLTVGDEVITVTKEDNNNYKITTETGTFTINPLEGIVLASNTRKTHEDEWGEVVVDEEGDLKIIKDYNNMPVSSVTIKLKAPAFIKGELADEGFSTWKAGEWHAMVLPFATKVRDISWAFTFGIVNVVDKEATEKAAAAGRTNEVHFKLQDINEVIPANTPFCIKTDEDFTYNNGTEADENGILYFGNIEGGFPKGAYAPLTIKCDATPSEDAGNGYTFDGTYAEMTIDKNLSYLRFLGTVNEVNKWYYIGKTSENKVILQPYTGYVNLGEANATREVNFFFEEEDGSTTAINAADFVNGNKANAEGLYRIDGVKVQGATTQKGVYIQDGKKFVK